MFDWKRPTPASSLDSSFSSLSTSGFAAPATRKAVGCESASPAASVPAFMFAMSFASPLESRSPTCVASASYLPTFIGSPVRPSTVRTPSAQAASRSDCRLMRFRSRPVICMIGSSPSSSIHAEQARGDSLTVAAWLSVTLAASTTGASARAALRTSSASGSTGGPSSAVTVKRPEARTSASMGSQPTHQARGAPRRGGAGGIGQATLGVVQPRLDDLVREDGLHVTILRLRRRTGIGHSHPVFGADPLRARQRVHPVDPRAQARVIVAEGLVLGEDPVERLGVAGVVEHRVLQERERAHVGGADPVAGQEVAVGEQVLEDVHARAHEAGVLRDALRVGIGPVELV